MKQSPGIAPPEIHRQAKEVLTAVKSKMGMISILLTILAYRPAVLHGFLAYSAALAQGTLPPALREQIARTAPGRNACDFCASVHTFLAEAAGVSDIAFSISS